MPCTSRNKIVQIHKSTADFGHIRQRFSNKRMVRNQRNSSPCLFAPDPAPDPRHFQCSCSPASSSTIPPWRSRIAASSCCHPSLPHAEHYVVFPHRSVALAHRCLVFVHHCGVLVDASLVLHAHSGVLDPSLLGPQRALPRPRRPLPRPTPRTTSSLSCYCRRNKTPRAPRIIHGPLQRISMGIVDERTRTSKGIIHGTD